jgi:hypothetical protein
VSESVASDSARETDVHAQRAGDALRDLAAARGPALAVALAKLMTLLADEATRSARFAKTLTAAITVPNEDPGRKEPPRPHRRAPGVFDPFAIFAAGGEPQLRSRLQALDLEQLRDIVAQHGMDHDRLALRWKDSQRVIERIVDKVSTRSTKGSAFRIPEQ